MEIQFIPFHGIVKVMKSFDPQAVMLNFFQYSADYNASRLKMNVSETVKYLVRCLSRSKQHESTSNFS